MPRRGEEIVNRELNRRERRDPPRGQDEFSQIVPSKHKIYFTPDKVRYWKSDSRGEWFQISRSDLTMRFREEGLSQKLICANFLTQVENEIIRIQEDCRIEWAGRLAGYDAGLYRICSYPVLITSSPVLPQPKEGRWQELKTYLGELLGEEVYRFYGWLRAARQSLKAGPPWRPGQALVIAGPPGAGKSFLQGIVTELLGGRSARPYRYMKEKTDFNAELVGAEHLIIEDESPSRDMSSRRVFGGFIKNMVANEITSFHPKGKDALMLTPFSRISISLNDEPEDLLVLPPLEKAVADKFIMLRCFQANFPFKSDGPQDRRAFRELLSSQLPAFLHFLQRWKVPAAMKDSRYGVVSWQDPSLVEALRSLSAEVQLLHMIVASGVLTFNGGRFEGTAAELENKLRDFYKRGELDRILTFPTAMGVFLQRLSKTRPDCVQPGPVVHGFRRWIVSTGTA